MSIERVNAEVANAASAAIRRVAPQRTRRWVIASVAMLVAAGVVFCVLVVVCRDKQHRHNAIDELADVRQWLQEFADEHGYLPPKLPDEIGFGESSPSLPYPSVQIIRIFRSQPGSHVLVAGPIRGMILPGKDGGAAVVYDEGKLSVRWLSRPQLRAEARNRRELFGGG